MLAAASEDENKVPQMWVSHGAYTLNCHDKEVVLSRKGWLCMLCCCLCAAVSAVNSAAVYVLLSMLYSAAVSAVYSPAVYLLLSMLYTLLKYCPLCYVSCA